MNTLQVVATVVTIASGLASLVWTISKFGLDNILKRAALIAICCVCAYFLVTRLVPSFLLNRQDSTIQSPELLSIELLDEICWETSEAHERLRFPGLPSGLRWVVIDPPRTAQNGAFVQEDTYLLPRGVSSPIRVWITNDPTRGKVLSSSIRFVYRPTNELLEVRLDLLRKAVASYASDHGGAFPKDVTSQLFNATNANGVTGEKGNAYPFGPYLTGRFLINPFNGSRGVREIQHVLSEEDIMDTTWIGWFYNPATGSIWPNTKQFLGKPDLTSEIAQVAQAKPNSGNSSPQVSELSDMQRKIQAAEVDKLQLEARWQWLISKEGILTSDDIHELPLLNAKIREISEKISQLKRDLETARAKNEGAN